MVLGLNTERERERIGLPTALKTTLNCEQKVPFNLPGLVIQQNEDQRAYLEKIVVRINKYQHRMGDLVDEKFAHEKQRKQNDEEIDFELVQFLHVGRWADGLIGQNG